MATKKAPNPLANLMRKPKLKVQLPSKGNYWLEGSIEFSEDNEYPVYSLTARDELALQNPASVASGQAIANAIQSCIPSIKNAWAAPGTDIDALLIAIRIASLGREFKTKSVINDKEYEIVIDLYQALDQLYNGPEWNGRFVLDEDITIFLRPVSYKTLSNMTSETAETQRIMDIINDETADEDRKIEVFKKSFSKLTDITMNFVQQCVYRIDVGDESVINFDHIKEYIENCDSEVFTKIKNKIDELSELHSIKPLKMKATDEMLADGCEEEVEVAVNYDLTNFFSPESE